MVAAPGSVADDDIPMSMSWSSRNSGAYRSTTALLSAGTELAPLATKRPHLRASASSARMPQTKSLPSAMSM